MTRELDYGQYSLSYETIFEDFPKDLFPNRSIGYEKEYDEKGRLTKLMRSYFDIKIHNTTYYTYNEYGNLVQEKLVYDDGRFEITNFHYIPFADSTDHIISEMNYETDPERFEMKQYYYNKKVQLIEVRELSQIRWDHRTNYKYDTAGRLIKELNFNVEKKLMIDRNTGIEKISDSIDIYYRKETEYNNDGTIKLTIDGCAPYLVKLACAKTYFEYDDKKRVIKKTFYWGDSLFSHRQYQYNPDNTLKKLEWFYKDEIKPKNQAEYFYEKKELSKAIFIDGDKTTVFEFNYQSDSHNNWTEQIKIVDNKPFYIRKREITYWD